jgi:predicted dehydrogenase
MLQAAVYGTGRWGQRLVDSVQGQSEKIRFAVAITRDPAAQRGFADKTGVALSQSYEDILRDPKIDAVVLATPHSQHHVQIVQAAQAGKHVFVEKPLTLTRRTAEQAVEACRAAGVTLGLGFNRRYAPSFLELMRRLRAGQIGDVLHVEAQFSGPSGLALKPENWRASRSECPAGAMTPRGVHTLDAMIHIAGAVRTVYAFSDRRRLAVDIDDTTSCLLRFTNGVTGYLGTLHATGELWRVHVFGTKAWLEMRADTELTARALEGAPQQLSFAAVDKERAVLEAFADAVAGKQPFVVAAEEAVNGVAALEAIVASAASGSPVHIG